MKHLFISRKVLVVIGLFGLGIFSFCNRQSVDRSYASFSDGGIFTKMESYTPALVQKGVSVFENDLKNGRLSEEAYDKLFNEVLQKLKLEDHLSVLPFSEIKQDLSRLLSSLSEKIASDTGEENDLGFLDDYVLQFMSTVKALSVKSSLAFYASFVKSLLRYAANNEVVAERIHALIAFYKGKDGVFTLWQTGCGSDRFKCRMAFISEAMMDSGSIIIGGLYGAFHGDCSRCAVCGRCD